MLLFANTLQDPKELMNVLEDFCTHSELSVNDNKSLKELKLGMCLSCFCYMQIHMLKDAYKLMSVLKNICLHNKLNFNASKTKVMLVRNQNNDKPCIVNNNESFQIIESIPYIGL